MTPCFSLLRKPLYSVIVYNEMKLESSDHAFQHTLQITSVYNQHAVATACQFNNLHKGELPKQKGIARYTIVYIKQWIKSVSCDKEF